MSRKSRERREKNKTVRPDDYFSNGTFEMARFGKNTIVRNNRTPEQHAAQMEYLRAEYASKYEDIAQKVKSLKEKVHQAGRGHPRECPRSQGKTHGGFGKPE